jgi:hypothetical protein
MLRKLAALSVFAATLFAQRSVSPGNMYHRVYAVVPFVGSGTKADPKRPMLVPAPAQAAGDRSGLLGFQMQLSDDGQFALVELVFQNPVAFQSVLAQEAASRGLSTLIGGLPAVAVDGSDLRALAANIAALKGALESAIPGLQLFERGKASDAAILAAFRARKANFALNVFTVRPQ